MNINKILNILLNNISLIMWTIGWLAFSVAGFLLGLTIGFIVIGAGSLVTSYLINVNGGD